MADKKKKQSKGSISEEDVSTLLEKYSPMTILALLQEVSLVPEAKIDWDSLVKNTATGITSAREYQMLWRHLAYRHALLDGLDDEAEPLDDDSDLEYELEASPPVTSEASAEATAFVKVLMASSSSYDSSQTSGSTIEGPLTMNIPSNQNNRVPADSSDPSTCIKGTNITIPVSVQKQPLPSVTCAEAPDANAVPSSNIPPRRKRKPWSAEEDMELIAAVQKYGESNWATIVRGDFKGERTANQLSQRWNLIKKRQHDLNVGGGPQLSEAQLATRRAVSLALRDDNLKAARPINAGSSSSNTVGPGSKSAVAAIGNNGNTAAASQTLPAGAQSQHQSQQDPASPTHHPLGATGATKPRVVKRPPVKPVLSPGSMVKATAVAAGARIATPADAASILKATQSKNALHIMPGGVMRKYFAVGSTNQVPGSMLEVCSRSTTPISTNTIPSTNASPPVGVAGQQGQSFPVKVAAAPGHSNPGSVALGRNMSSRKTNVAPTTTPVTEVAAPAVEPASSSSQNEREKPIQGDQSALSGKQPGKIEKDYSSSEPPLGVQNQASTPTDNPINQSQNDQNARVSSETNNGGSLKCQSAETPTCSNASAACTSTGENEGEKTNGNQNPSKEVGEIQRVDGNQRERPDEVMEETDGNADRSGRAATDNMKDWE